MQTEDERERGKMSPVHQAINFLGEEMGRTWFCVHAVLQYGTGMEEYEVQVGGAGGCTGHSYWLHADSRGCRSKEERTDPTDRARTRS